MNDTKALDHFVDKRNWTYIHDHERTPYLDYVGDGTTIETVRLAAAELTELKERLATQEHGYELQVTKSDRDEKTIRQLRAENERLNQVDKAYQLAVHEAVVATDERNRLRAELDEEKSRNNIFEDCLHRALELWQEVYPDKQFWPDGATNLAWVFDRFTRNKIALDEAIRVIVKLLTNPIPTGMSMFSQREIEARYKKHETASDEADAFLARMKEKK